MTTVWIALAMSPARADAQLETVVQATRELAVAAEQPEPARTSGVRASVERMAAALVVWDGNIRALEARVRRDGRAPSAGNTQLHVELGVAYRFRGRLADALREFDAAVALRPSSDVQVLRALTLEAMGRPAVAAQAFRTAWMLDPANPVKAYYVADRDGSDAADRTRAHEALRSAYRDLGRSTTAAAAPRPFMTLDAIPDTMSVRAVAADADMAEAFSLLVSGKFSEAVAALQRTGPKATGTNAENSPRGHLTRGLAAEAANRIADARREYQAGLPGTLAGRSVVYVAIARLAQVDGDSAGAIDAYTHAVRLNPNDANIHKEFAASLAADGRADEAFRELAAALLIDSRDATAHAEIGKLFLNTGRYADAVNALGRALQLAPQGYEARYSLATAYTRLGDSAKATQEFEAYDRARREALEQRRKSLNGGRE